MGLDSLDLSGRIAVVVGGATGIGRAIANGFALAGADVVASSRRSDMVAAVADEIESHGRRTLRNSVDVTDADSIRKLLQSCVDEFGGVDILVNSAGTTKKVSTLEMDFADWSRIIDVNLTGTMLSCVIFGEHMLHRKWGRIINISSIFGKQPGGLVDYDAIKAAVIMFGKDLANYLAKDNILVNTICPGPIRTPLWEGPGALGEQLGSVLNMSGSEAIKWFAEQNIPLGHHGDPEDIANLVAFLASDKAKFITGQAINVDGGMVKSNI